jgi:hemerythrin-like domain-containing protein
MAGALNLNEIPVGLLITEHRLIGRFLALMKKEIEQMNEGEKPDRVFIERVIDFFHTYAHRCHYGKEEDLLFQRLHMKKLQPEHKEMIDELVLDHIRERRLIDGLEIAKDRYWLGHSEALDEILNRLKDIGEFYPGHMRKEETELFCSSMEYFDPEEQQRMLAEFAELDRNLIHEQYLRIAEKYEEKKFFPPSFVAGQP